MQVIRQYHGHLSGVYSIALHPRLDVVMTGGRDSVCRVWDMRTKLQVWLSCRPDPRANHVKLFMHMSANPFLFHSSSHLPLLLSMLHLRSSACQGMTRLCAPS